MHASSVVMHKELRNALAVVIPADRLSQEIVHGQNDQLVPGLSQLVLGDGECVGDDDLLDALAIDHLLQAVTAEQAVRGHTVHLCGAAALGNRLGGSDPRGGLVDHVVDNQDGSILDIADQRDHGLHVGVLEIFLFVFGRGRSVIGAAQGMRMLAVVVVLDG